MNGTPKGFFLAAWGLRLGDLLSPFHFLIVVEALSRMIKGAMNVGLFEGFKVARDTLAINILQFADDNLIMWSKRRPTLGMSKPQSFVLKQSQGLRLISLRVSCLG